MLTIKWRGGFDLNINGALLFKHRGGKKQLRRAGKILNRAMTPPRCAVTMTVGSPVTQTLTVYAVCLRFRQQAGSLSPFFPLECLLGKTNCHCLPLSSDGITWQPVYFLHRNVSLAVRRALGDSEPNMSREASSSLRVSVKKNLSGQWIKKSTVSLNSPWPCLIHSLQYVKKLKTRMTFSQSIF